MRVNFRQGIINYQHPSFLHINRTSIDLVVTTTPLLFTIASGPKDYLFVENNSVTNAWTSLIPNTDQWIYIDYDTRTLVRRFGTTRFSPVIGATPPIQPAVDKHWFNTNTKQMTVWNGTSWIPKIRIILAKIQQGSVPISISQNSPIFSGTQIGDNTSVLAGTVLFNNQTGSPLTDNSGRFITTEDNLHTENTNTSIVKFANTLILASADQPMAAYTFVTFSSFGHIVHANSFTASHDVPYGMIIDDVITGATTNVVTTGIISSNTWDWSHVDVNTPLYCDNFGALTTTPVIPQQIYSALVIDTNTILLGPPRQIFTGSGSAPVEVPMMTDTIPGIARLSVPAVSAINPIVVGNNDPRLTGNLLLTGGTMTGTLTLSSNPVNPLEAATKQYVDSKQVSLTSLSDVLLTPLITGQILSYNGTKWVNINNTSSTSLPDIIVPSTATKVTFNTKGLITSSSGLLATDIPNLNWTKITNVPTLNFTGDITGTGSIGTTITTTLANSGVIIGTYNNVTVNAKGLVTSGTLQDVVLHPATTLTIGGIIVGSGLAIDTNGTLSTIDVDTITSGNFAVQGDCIARELVLYGISTSAVLVDLLLGGTTGLVLSDNSSWGYDITVVGTRTDGTTGNGTWRFSGNIHRELGTATTAITPNPYDIIVSMSDPSWIVTVTANPTTGSLDIKAGGSANSIVRWAAFVKTVEIKY